MPECSGSGRGCLQGWPPPRAGPANEPPQSPRTQMLYTMLFSPLHLQILKGYIVTCQSSISSKWRSQTQASPVLSTAAQLPPAAQCQGSGGEAAPLSWGALPRGGARPPWGMGCNRWSLAPPIRPEQQETRLRLALACARPSGPYSASLPAPQRARAPRRTARRCHHPGHV